MTPRKELIESMYKTFGTWFLSFAQLKQFTNLGRDKLRGTLRDVPHQGNGPGKRWFIEDVADALRQNARLGV